MKKLFYSLLLGCAALPLSAQSLFEQYERYLTDPRTYICYRTDGKLEIDGKLDEPSWQQTVPTVPFADISGEGFPTPKYETTARMLWDDDYLYVGAVLQEENIQAHLTQRDTIIYYDNDFEVFIDPDGDGQNYFEIETNARGVIFDLMLDKPYRCDGNFMLQWDCPGLKAAVHHEGTLNDPTDKDTYWSVEMAIPRQALALNFDNPLVAGNTWRINFSRVEWLKENGPEENWVWSPTGKVDMHMPDRWGYLYFSDKVVGTSQGDEIVFPYNPAIYKLLCAMFYAQQDPYETRQDYLRSLEQFALTDKELGMLPAGAEIEVEATQHLFRIAITNPAEGVRYVVNNEGRFGKEELNSTK